MLDTLTKLFDSEDFMPHGHCFLWSPDILWLHVASDAIIAFSYFSIPMALLVFAERRRDLPFRYIFSLFGAFIILCGSTHLASIWVLWFPDYGPEGLLKAATATVSAATAALVWFILPRALKLPTPTDLRIINENLQQSNVRIEKEVEKRTNELQAAHDQLVDNERTMQHALQQAEMASEAKSEFLANMSHEIRTPMNALVGLTHILSNDKTLSPRQKECINTMSVSATALMDLLNDLFDIAKIETGHIEFYEKPFNLRSVISDAVTIMMVRAKEKGLDLSMQVAGFLPDKNADDVIGDAARLRQVLTNLLSNAIKFTSQGRVALRAGAQPLPTGVALVTLEIADTGIGIAPEHIPHIFDKFTQADSSISRRYGGSGLGLAITRSLVEQMKGRIEVQSVLGEGASFVVTLELPMTPASPLRIGSLQKGTMTQAVMENEDAQIYEVKTKGKGLILLVEDWQPNILVAGLMLEMLGYHYEIARSGDVAIDMFEKRNYDAILMDIQLPGVDGFEATRNIRALEKKLGKKPTPIIATTAYAMKNDRDKCIAAGMDNYLPKPLDVQQLDEVLRSVLIGAA